MDKYLDTLRRILNPYERTAEPAAGDRGVASAHVKGVDKDKRQVTAVLSTPSVDRYGEVVLPSAFEKTIDQFRANPKFLGAHAWGSDSGRPTSIGRWIDVQITKDAVLGTAQFLEPGDELADSWWTRFAQGVVNTFSIGFLVHPNGYEFRDVEVDGQRKRIRHFTSASLVEVSAVEIPANPDAMLRQFGVADSGGVASGGGAGLDYKQLAEAVMNHGLGDTIQQQITKVLTDPLGPVDSLIREIVAAVLDGRSLGHHSYDDDATPPVRTAGHDELKAGLKDLLG